MALGNTEPHTERKLLLGDSINLAAHVKEGGSVWCHIPATVAGFPFHKELRELASSLELLASNGVC